MNELEKKNRELLEELEKLNRKIQKIKERKKYGLVWEEEKEPEQIVLDCQYKIPILREVFFPSLVDRSESISDFDTKGLRSCFKNLPL